MQEKKYGSKKINRHYDFGRKIKRYHASLLHHERKKGKCGRTLLDGWLDVDMDKVIRMILIHDLGECFTGDIPVFNKTPEHEEKEKELLYNWVKTLPGGLADEMLALYEEMEKRETTEAKVFKAIDGMEAVLQHNISDISTWLPNEYELNQTYATDKVAFSEYLKEVREELRKDTVKKIEESEK